MFVVKLVNNRDPWSLTDSSSVSLIQLDQELPINILSITLKKIVTINNLLKLHMHLVVKCKQCDFTSRCTASPKISNKLAN